MHRDSSASPGRFSTWARRPRLGRRREVLGAGRCRRRRAALRVGASGFLVKDTPPADIINAVRLVAAGDAIVSPSVTRTLLSHFGNTEASDRHRMAAQRLAALTDRERDVATAVGEGASNAEIAASLFMSQATVKAYVSRLLSKLDASNRVQLAILVHDAGHA